MHVQLFFEMAGNVARHQCGADLARLERRHLLVQRADADALRVVQYRAVGRARDVVFGILGRRTHVDDAIEFGELCYGGARVIKLSQFSIRDGIRSRILTITNPS